MGDLQDIFGSIGVQTSLFFTGVGAGATVLATEMIFFAGNMIVGILSNSFQATEVVNSSVSNYYFIIFILTIAGLIQGVLIGVFKNVAFSFGYVFGVLFMVLFLGSALYSIAPTVVIGVILAFISVVVGLLLKGFN